MKTVVVENFGVKENLIFEEMELLIFEESWLALVGLMVHHLHLAQEKNLLAKKIEQILMLDPKLGQDLFETGHPLHEID